MLKQLYRFQIQDQVLTDVWTAVDTADQATVWLLGVSLVPERREQMISGLRAAASERRIEICSAEGMVYLVTKTRAETNELRARLVERGLVAPRVETTPELHDISKRRQKWNILRWGVILPVLIVALIVGAFVAARRPGVSPQPDASVTSPEPNRTMPSPNSLEAGKAAFAQKQYADAERFFTKACSEGAAQGCGYLGYLAATGLDGRKKNKSRARPLYVRGCDLGDLRSCYSLASIDQDLHQFAEARTLFRKACDGGVDEACKELNLETGGAKEPLPPGASPQ